MNDNNNKVTCAYCDKVLKDDDIVYYLEAENDLSYCCPEHLIKNLDFSEVYARCWNNEKD